MIYRLVIILGLTLLANASHAQSEALDADDVVGIEAIDDTESFGIGTDSHSEKWFYKCVAYPKGDDCGHGGFWGEGWSMQDAKHDALQDCSSSTHKHCYVKQCKKFKK